MEAVVHGRGGRHLQEDLQLVAEEGPAPRNRRPARQRVLARVLARPASGQVGESVRLRRRGHLPLLALPAGHREEPRA